ncbi:Laminin subunit alpha-3 [Tupaia chinensis]|uniref:Laminin subunit alpha-3 n=1 Tax=Tupaia chinensis TaxID=246437 RepID=L9JF25_TUPCH|nr:Laminin subunit alpha-3 [Tupaia chinensis]
MAGGPGQSSIASWWAAPRPRAAATPSREQENKGRSKRKKTKMGQFCDYCNSEDPQKAHPVTNAIDGSERWWQSPPLSSGTQYNRVNLTLDLGQLFHVAYILIKFANSPRPDLWILERSVDFGSTYTPWQYFAHSKVDCLEQFGQEANTAITQDDDVLCITEYSRIVPLENGEVVVSLINGRPGAKNFTFSHTLREFTKATNIRLRFLRTNTLLGHLISKAQRDPTVTRRYYYSIKDISIGGQCVCNGHAEVCNANNPEKLFRCECQHHTCGETCDRCCAGFSQKRWRPATWEQSNECEACNCHGHATDCYYDPDIEQQQASLNSQGVYAGGGVCINCQHNTAGVNCEKCAKGYYRPSGVPVDAPHGCIRCDCNLEGVLPEICDAYGRCLCRPGVEGPQCDTCFLGFYSFPICQACQCSALGSYQMPCNAVTGQCECRPGITGQRCDRCLSGAYDFPHCQACLCHEAGTVSGIGECGQRDGDCHCKPHVDGDSCDTCEDGYFAVEKSNYFGCQGCHCDVGGALSPVCSGPSGMCQCREHVVGKSCQRPENNYYFPDLHHMKYEIEDGTTPTGRELRFGFDPLAFPEFSWRGYAQMTSIQNEVRIILNVEKSDLSLFRVILRYVNPGAEAVSGQITIYPSWDKTGAAQSKEIIFLPSKEPAFVTVPGNGFADPFSIIPGTWIACIKAEGVLLDYLVLLPRDYYEASALQVPVTEPCAYTGPPQENCLLYQHLPVTRFPCTLACEARHFLLDGEARPLAVRQPTPAHPVMADLSGTEMELHLRLRVPQVGHYVAVVEYATDADQLLLVDVNLKSPGSVLAGQVNIYSCKYSVLCRSIVVDDLGRMAVYELLADADIQLKAHVARFFLHRICIIPIEEFSTEYMRPQVHCIASYGRFVNQSATCVSLAHETPPKALILDVPSGEPLSPLLQDSTPSASIVTGITLKAPQNQVTLRGHIPHLGRYVFVIHYYQADHPMFPAQVFVDRGQPLSGSFRASFCPHVLGCQDQVLTEGQIEFDISEPEVAVTVKVPEGKSLVLVRVLVVPAENYNYQLLHKKSVDKSFEFINDCGEDSFYIDPRTASRFCKNSARSLVAFYHNGALPCECHPTGAVGHHCSPEGGQCPCQPNVIGRQCTRCGTGYYGFPLCKPCNCGRRLCEEITGKCLCPPGTVRPQCEACEMHSFSFHPLAGCEGCNCSRSGIVGATTPECDRDSGQCRCKPRITGRQCDRCASGFYHFPECVPCNCNRDGTEPGVCDAVTGACLCKENVEGTKCSMCREGSFHLDSANPKGCTTCFCFGINNRCHSTHKRRAKFVDMMGWRLETEDGVDIPVSFNPGSNSVVADLQELPSAVRSASWVAPPSYLGDKVSSYGGYLTYQVKSFGLPGDMVLLEKKPDVQLTGGHLTIVYEEPSNPRPDRLHHGRLQMIEGNFRHAGTRGPVSREELMMVLSRLEGVRIRGLHFTETQRLTLGEVGLEEASDTGSGRIAHHVEMCACPPDYSGDSCQNCAHNTAGEHCERCKEGYYGNAVHGSCRICPCPHSNSFATGCVVNGGNVRCSCKPGYTGTQCERCAPGYFGNPQKFGGSCQPCNCNNNGQLGSCDPVNGDCINQEPKDGGPSEECDDCDSCVMTLLNDLASMGEELRLLKSQLQGLSVSASALEQMRHVETQAKDLRNQLLNYRSAISNHGSKMNGLEKELNNLNREFETLQEKAQINSRKAQTLYNNVDQTTQRAKELDTKIKNVIRNVHILLKQISGTDGEGNNLPSGDFSRELAEAERMMRELRNRNFRKHLQEAETERREAQLLLTRIKNWPETHQVENSELMKSIWNSLKEYEAKVTDLRAALQEAAAQAKQATGLNQENERVLGAIKKHMNEINSLQSDFTKYLTTADSSLLKTNIALQLMEKGHKEYEKLAAALNEARQEISDRERELSRSASKLSLVEEAEMHAQSLQELAKQLEEIKRNASGDELVRCAVDAATAYESILNAIKAAEDAANKASSASDSALQTVIKEDLPRKAKTLSSESDKLLNEAKITQKRLQQEISPALNNLQQTLKIVTVQKELIDTNLTSVRDDLRGIQRGDIDGMINSAKSLIRKANGITDEVLDGLNPIQTDVERIKDTYGSTQSEDFNKALTDADNSVKRLTNKLPDLLSKIESINQQLLPLGNISDNVDRIRELIQQARDAANKVAIPMRFNGKSGVEVRLPNDLEDLKGYTSLSLFLQRPDSRETGGTENMFVMYLGNKDASRDYIGMAVVDGQLTCVYNLGGREAELQVDQILTKSESQEAVMDRVKFQRIYQFARLNYTKRATSIKPDNPQFHEMDSGNSNTLLNLDPENVVFYVGGYPPDFKLPSRLRFPQYRGCIELDDLNENVLSLYNFKKTFNLNTTEVEPCRRRREESDKNYFEGTGYARVPTQSNAPFPTFAQTIQTTVDRGLVFFAENQDHFISLNIEDGNLVVRHKLNSEPPKEKGIRDTINNGKDHTDHFISLNIEDGNLVVRHKLNSEPPKEKGIRDTINNGKDHTIQIKIGKTRELMWINVNSQNVKVEGELFDFSTYYLGGIPIAIRERFNISTPAFRGCMKNLKKTSGVVRLNDTVGVTKKCSEDWKLVRTASFSRGGQLSFSDLDSPRPSHFQASFGFQTFEPSGMLLNHQTWTSNLQVTLEDGHIELSTRDSSSPIFTSPGTYMDGLLHYVSVISDNAGLRLLIDDQPLRNNQRLPDFSDTQQSLRLGGSRFEGCISNVFVQRLSHSPEVLDLANRTTKRDVSLGGCSLNKPPFLMLFKGSTRFNKAKTFNINQVMQDTAVASPRSMEVWQDERSCPPPHGAQASHGALQFGDSPTSHLLFKLPQELLKPRSQFAVDVQTKSPRGLVFYSGTKNTFMALYFSKGRLVFTLGAEGKKLKLKSKEKCNDGKWHTVTFGQDGEKGRLIVDGLRAREGRLPGNSTVSISTPVYLGSSPSAKPKVVASVDSGAGGTLTSVTPKWSLCDGQWHSVAVTIKQHLLHLELDADSSYTVGQLAFPPVSSQEPLHIGGVPGDLRTLRLPVWKSFFGCLKNIQVNHIPVPVTEALAVQGSISLNGCPDH